MFRSLRVLAKVHRLLHYAVSVSILSLYPICWTAGGAEAQTPANLSSSDLVYINAKEIKDYLNFPSSPIKQMVRVNITYRQTTGDGHGEECAYEDLWYQEPHAVGLRRYRDFDLHPRDSIYIYTQASSPAEIAALANTLTRILLDASLNRNSIIGIEVPAGSLWPLTDRLETENFYRPGRYSGRPQVYVTMPLISDEGKKIMVVYFPQRGN
jgi:hypothetical protein